ncbi:MAG TPA: RagB/SusD family nutrient uptake outer membrane protein [Ferruginibacter sp.]|nr:RagB/SusD family nutrient uptake outer membrane protein [Ferruginibacter sp.]
MYKKIIFIIVAAVSLTSCKKDPTNVAPNNELDATSYPKTVADLNSFLTPGYSNIRTASLYGQHFMPFVLSVDHTFCSQAVGNLFGTPGGGPLINNIGVNDNANGSIYSQLYQGIAYMNLCFDRIAYYQNVYGHSHDAEVATIRGQAEFLRAYYFFLLECYYGEQYIDLKQPENPNILGVPLPTVIATTYAEANLPRASAYKVWTQIITDLKASAQDLQSTTYASTDEGRVSQWAAYGLLGKAYVFTKEYDSAKVCLLKVINNGVNSLMPFNKYKNAFNGNSANEFNEESLFEINVDRQEALPGIVFGAYPANLQSLTTDQGETFAPTILSGTGLDGTGGGAANMGNNYCQYFVHDKNLARFGFKLPIYTYRTNPLYVGPGPGTAATPQLIMDSTSWAKSDSVRSNPLLGVDPRLFVCALEPWVDSCEQPYAASQPGATPATAPDTIPVGKAYIIPSNRTSYWGWSFKKYATLDNNLAAYGGNDAANLYLLRLADVYLLYAEACEATGDNPDALTYINKVHERAYGGSTAYDYLSVTSPTLANPSDVDLANNPLHYERYVELFGECGWYFDVCRWGVGANEASYYVYGTADYNPGTSTGPVNSIIDPSNWSTTNSRAYHFPIPLAEIESNPSIQRNNNPY